MNVCVFGDAQSVHLQQLVPGLVALGLRVHVVTHKPAELSGATVERYAVPPPGLGNLRRWRQRRREYLRGFLRRFDLINFHFLQDWGFSCEHSGVGNEALESACMVATAWGSDIVDPPGETPASTALMAMRRQLLRAACKVSACGPSFAAHVEAYAGLSSGEVAVLPFGVDVDRFTPADSAGGRKPPVVGFFKGFRAVYGPMHLIRGMPLILAQVPHARFELVGDGPMLKQCQCAASDLGVADSVSWIPRQHHSRLPSILSRWAVSVIPSEFEAFGVAALESAAMELPVVAADVCGLRDTVLHEQTGLLFPSGDHQQLAAAVVRILRDRDLAGELGTNGCARVRDQFDWRSILPKWAGAFRAARSTHGLRAPILAGA